MGRLLGYPNLLQVNALCYRLGLGLDGQNRTCEVRKVIV